MEYEDARLHVKIPQRAIHYRLFESKKKSDRIAAWIADHIVPAQECCSGKCKR